MSNKTIYLKRIPKPNFSVHSVDLDFDLYDDHVIVTNTRSLKECGRENLNCMGMNWN